MRKLQTTYTTSPLKRIACLGDSHTNNWGLGVNSDQFYAARLQGLLKTAGAKVLARNFGISGHTTSDLIRRQAALTTMEVPDLAIIYVGTNDGNAQGSSTVVASPAPTTTSASVASGTGKQFAPGCNVLINGQSVKIQTQSTDALTWTPALSAAPATGATIALDTQTNIVTLGTNIKNAMTAAGKTPRVVICGQHYLNYSSGGDTVGTPYAPNATLRSQQQAAAATVGAVYCDFFAGMAARITNGTDTQGSYKWHVLDSNSHLNAYGQSILASLLNSTITAQSGWLAALS